MAAKCCFVNGIFGGIIAHQILTPIFVPLVGDGGKADAGEGGHDAFDLAQLDSQTPDLHLSIDAAQVFDLPVHAPPGQIAGTVHGLSGTEGVRQEPLRRQVGSIQIALAHAVAGNTQLTGHDDGQQLLMPIEDVDLGVGDGLADGDIVAGHLLDGGPDGCLGGTVIIEDSGVGDGSEFPMEVGRQGLSAQYKSFYAVEILQIVAVCNVESHFGRRRFQNIDLSGLEEFGKFLLRDDLLIVGQVDCDSGDQRKDGFCDRHIEGCAGYGQNGVIGIRNDLVDDIEGIAVGEVYGVAVADRQPLWFACGAGGEDDVTEVVTGVLIGNRCNIRGIIEVLQGNGFHWPRFAIAAGQTDAAPGNFKHIANAVAGIGGIHGHIGTAGLQYAKHGRDDLPASFGDDGYQTSGSNALRS